MSESGSGGAKAADDSRPQTQSGSAAEGNSECLPGARDANSNFQYDKKIYKDIEVRGWTDSLIDDVITNPHATSPAANKATGGDATAYFRSDGAYVVRDNATGKIIQVSKIGDPGWIPDVTIQNPYRPQ